MTERMGILDVEQIMACLLWAVFFVVLFVLQKFAWKPILAGLKQREDDIRKSIENADKIKAELAAIEVSKAKILSEAKDRASVIVEQSRKMGNELASQIEERARQNAQEIIASAHQEIEGERDRVRNALKRESVQTAVSLAEKILKENIDPAKNRNLIDQAIKDV